MGRFTEYEIDANRFGDNRLIDVIEQIKKVGAGRNESCHKTGL